MLVWITSESTKSRYLLLLITLRVSKLALTKLHAVTATQRWCNQFKTTKPFLISQVAWGNIDLGLHLYESNCVCKKVKRSLYCKCAQRMMIGHRRQCRMAQNRKLCQSPKYWNQQIWVRYTEKIWKASAFAVLLLWSAHFGDSHWYTQGSARLFV